MDPFATPGTCVPISTACLRSARCPRRKFFQDEAGVAPGQAPISASTTCRPYSSSAAAAPLCLHQQQWSWLWRANICRSDRYRERRVFLAGVAAHIHPPAGGQGMTTGIQGAYNLGWKLAAVIKGASPALRGSHFTLLNFGPTAVVEASFFDLKTYHIVEQPIGPHDLADSESQLARACNPTSRTLVLIRPTAA